jgi:hypothetical protein
MSSQYYAPRLSKVSILLKLAVDSNSFALAVTGGIVVEIKNAINASFSS